MTWFKFNYPPKVSMPCSSHARSFHDVIHTRGLDSSGQRNEHETFICCSSWLIDFIASKRITVIVLSRNWSSSPGHMFVWMLHVWHDHQTTHWVAHCSCTIRCSPCEYRTVTSASGRVQSLIDYCLPHLSIALAFQRTRNSNIATDHPRRSTAYIYIYLGQHRHPPEIRRLERLQKPQVYRSALKTSGNRL